MSVPEAQQSWQKRNLKSLGIGLLTALVICLIFLVEDVTNLGILHNTEARLVDLRFRLRGPEAPSGSSPTWRQTPRLRGTTSPWS